MCLLMEAVLLFSWMPTSLAQCRPCQNDSLTLALEGVEGGDGVQQHVFLPSNSSPTFRCTTTYSDIDEGSIYINGSIPDPEHASMRSNSYVISLKYLNFMYEAVIECFARLTSFCENCRSNRIFASVTGVGMDAQTPQDTTQQPVADSVTTAEGLAQTSQSTSTEKSNDEGTGNITSDPPPASEISYQGDWQASEASKTLSGVGIAVPVVTVVVAVVLAALVILLCYKWKKSKETNRMNLLNESHRSNGTFGLNASYNGSCSHSSPARVEAQIMVLVLKEGDSMEENIVKSSSQLSINKVPADRFHTGKTFQNEDAAQEDDTHGDQESVCKEENITKTGESAGDRSSLQDVKICPDEDADMAKKQDTVHDEDTIQAPDRLHAVDSVINATQDGSGVQHDGLSLKDDTPVDTDAVDYESVHLSNDPDNAVSSGKNRECHEVLPYCQESGQENESKNVFPTPERKTQTGEYLQYFQRMSKFPQATDSPMTQVAPPAKSSGLVNSDILSCKKKIPKEFPKSTTLRTSVECTPNGSLSSGTGAITDGTVIVNDIRRHPDGTMNPDGSEPSIDTSLPGGSGTGPPGGSETGSSDGSGTGSSNGSETGPSGGSGARPPNDTQYMMMDQFFLMQEPKDIMQSARTGDGSLMNFNAVTEKQLASHAVTDQ